MLVEVKWEKSSPQEKCMICDTLTYCRVVDYPLCVSCTQSSLCTTNVHIPNIYITDRQFSRALEVLDDLIPKIKLKLAMESVKESPITTKTSSIGEVSYRKLKSSGLRITSWNKKDSKVEISLENGSKGEMSIEDFDKETIEVVI